MEVIVEGAVTVLSPTFKTPEVEFGQCQNLSENKTEAKSTCKKWRKYSLSKRKKGRKKEERKKIATKQKYYYKVGFFLRCFKNRGSQGGSAV